MGCARMRAEAFGSGAKFALLAVEITCVALLVAFVSQIAPVKFVRLLALALFIVTILLILAGCQTDSQQLVSEPPPANYRQIAADHLRRTLFDPYSVRDAEIARPKPGQVYVDGMHHEEGWAVCWRANAKNRLGAYTGVKESIVVIRGDRVVASTSPDPGHYDLRTNCADARYEPFKEIEQARR